MKLYKFKVEGSGDFPVDMLRFDGCYPRTTEDAMNLKLGEFDRTKRRSIELLMPVENRQREPSTDRWNSFGWIITEIAFIK